MIVWVDCWFQEHVETLINEIIDGRLGIPMAAQHNLDPKKPLRVDINLRAFCYRSVLDELKKLPIRTWGFDPNSLFPTVNEKRSRLISRNFALRN